jgi:hypothetical protein
MQPAARSVSRMLPTAHIFAHNVLVASGALSRWNTCMSSASSHCRLGAHSQPRRIIKVRTWQIIKPGQCQRACSRSSDGRTRNGFCVMVMEYLLGIPA